MLKWDVHESHDDSRGRIFTSALFIGIKLLVPYYKSNHFHCSGSADRLYEEIIKNNQTILTV